jgi:hypothetical protein
VRNAANDRIDQIAAAANGSSDKLPERLIGKVASRPGCASPCRRLAIRLYLLALHTLMRLVFTRVLGKPCLPCTPNRESHRS